jgi:hypothetical protein
MADKPEKKAVVSSLSARFSRATKPTENVEEAKAEHRSGIKSLMDSYYQDVASGKAEGIQNAKQLVDLIKLDLLLLGEATERSESTLDEVKMAKLEQVVDVGDPLVKQLMDNALMAINGVNDDAEIKVKRVEVANPMDELDEEKKALHDSIRKEVLGETTEESTDEEETEEG